MNTFFIVLSFILHAISFFIIILLFIKGERTKDIERKQASMIKDMEDLLSAYILEMKEENESFLEKVKKNDMVVSNNSKNENQIKKKNKPASVIDQKEDLLTDEDILSLLPVYNEKIETKGKVNDSKELEILSISQQAKILMDQGMSIEDIAKKLGKGKTEIELFLKFHQ